MTAETASSVQAVEGRVDKLTQALLYVAGELWVARDRQVVLERLLAEKGIAEPASIDGYRPDTALAQTLETEREAFVSRILAYLAPDAAR